MDGWTALIWTSVAVAGGWSYLRIVAAYIAYSQGVLERFERRKQNARKRRIQIARDEQIIIAERAAKEEAA